MAAQKIPELQEAIKKAGPNVKQYVADLEAKNLKLHEQIASLKADKVDLNNRIKAMENVLKKHGSPDLGDRLRRAREREIDEQAATMPEAELIEKMRALGYRVEKLPG